MHTYLALKYILGRSVWAQIEFENIPKERKKTKCRREARFLKGGVEAKEYPSIHFILFRTTEHSFFEASQFWHCLSVVIKVDCWYEEQSSTNNSTKSKKGRHITCVRSRDFK